MCAEIKGDRSAPLSASRSDACSVPLIYCQKISLFNDLLLPPPLPRRYSERPRSVPPMPPQTQALPARAGVRGPLLRPLALPPQHQRLSDRHGHVPEDRQEAGQLLQRHHLQQQAHRRVRAGSAEGKPKTKAGRGESRSLASGRLRRGEIRGGGSNE